MTPSISVITACKNSSQKVARLYDSLARQTYSNFEWVVVDGLSADGTYQLLQDFQQKHSWIRPISESDDGIYDAINKAIALASGDYYVVAGDDDTFNEHALRTYTQIAASRNADVVFARVYKAGRIIGGFHPRLAWIGPSRVFRSSHSIGTLFKRDLHDRFGLYSRRFPLLADVYFLKTLLRSGGVNFVDTDFVAGTFAEGGVTSLHHMQLLAENWQIQMLTEPFPSIQTVLLFGKILARYPAVRRELHTFRRCANNTASSACRAPSGLPLQPRDGSTVR